MLKSGLNIAHFRQHVSIIEKETKDYFRSWGESGEKSKRNILVSRLSEHVCFSVTRNVKNVCVCVCVKSTLQHV